MAKGTPWSDRSGDEQRRTLGRFAILYGVIALLGLAMGWFLIAGIFGAGTIGLFVFRSTTAPGEAEPEPERKKPDWMLAMDDPNAPDRSLPEYRTARRDQADAGTPTAGTRDATSDATHDTTSESAFAPPRTSGQVAPSSGPSGDPSHREG